MLNFLFCIVVRFSPVCLFNIHTMHQSVGTFEVPNTYTVVINFFLIAGTLWRKYFPN